MFPAYIRSERTEAQSEYNTFSLRVFFIHTERGGNYIVTLLKHSLGKFVHDSSIIETELLFKNISKRPKDTFYSYTHPLLFFSFMLLNKILSIAWSFI